MVGRRELTSQNSARFACGQQQGLSDREVTTRFPTKRSWLAWHCFSRGTSSAADILILRNTQGKVQQIVEELISSATCASSQRPPQGPHHPSASHSCALRPRKLTWVRSWEVQEQHGGPRTDRLHQAHNLQTALSSFFNSATAVPGKLRRKVLLTQASEGI